MKPLLEIIFQVKPVHIRDPKDVHACIISNSNTWTLYIYMYCNDIFIGLFKVCVFCSQYLAFNMKK